MASQRMTKTQWLEAEELYKQGWTQKEVAKKYGIRPETVSIHMAKAKVKGGEHVDVVRQELSEALNRKLKEFAEKRASRQIDTKEKFHTLINTMLGLYVKEIKIAQDTGQSLEKLAGAGRALKEAIAGMKLAREELYVLLDIRPETDMENTPDLFVMPMTEEEEERIRGAGGSAIDDDEPEIPDIDSLLPPESMEGIDGA
jgi:predicted transcriptional regulator